MNGGQLPTNQLHDINYRRLIMVRNSNYFADNQFKGIIIDWGL